MVEGCVSRFKCNGEKVIPIHGGKERKCLTFFFQNEVLYFHGSVKMRVIRGNISVLGHTLRASSKYHLLHSPLTSSCLSIYTTSAVKSSLEAEKPDRNESEDDDAMIMDLLAKRDIAYATGVVIFKQSPVVDGQEENINISKYLDGNFVYDDEQALIEGIVATSNAPKKQKITEAKERDADKFFLIPNFYPILQETGIQGLIFPNAWADLREQVVAEERKAANTIVLVCGTKNAGKSTLARYLTNGFLNKLNKIAYLESDVGQCEFTPAGMVSLNIVDEPLLGNNENLGLFDFEYKGPPWTHVKTPVKSYYLGSPSPKNDPGSYLQCVHQCFNHYCHIREKYGDLPLVVNTHGWIRGLGLDLLLQIIRFIQPHYIIQVQSTAKETPIDIKSFARQLAEYNPDFRIFQTPEINAASVVTTPQDRRMLRTRSYFGHPLHSLVPYKILWSNVRIQLLNGSVAPSQVMFALNGAIVALGSLPNEHINASVNQVANSIGFPIILPSSTPLCECYGLGIVRAIDPVEKAFYIITPMSEEWLNGKNINVLLKGDIELSPSLIQGSIPFKENEMPYMTTNSISNEGSGSGEIRARPNVKRKALDAR